MADTDALKAYRVGNATTLPGGDKLYLMRELRKIEDTLKTVSQIMVLLEARIEALEP